MKSGYGILLFLALGACGNAESQSATEQATTVPLVTRSIQTDSIQASRHSAIVTAAARVAPSVVSVNVTRRTRRAPRTAWEQFFMPRGSEQVVEGFGSGFIITSDGIVITNQHVANGATEIVVTTRDGTDYDAELLGQDPLTDIAVLRIDGDDLPTAPIGGSTDLVIGAGKALRREAC